MMAEYMAVKKPVFTILTPYGEFRGTYEPSDELQGFLRFDTQGHIIFGYSKLDDRILIQYDKWSGLFFKIPVCFLLNDNPSESSIFLYAIIEESMHHSAQRKSA